MLNFCRLVLTELCWDVTPDHYRRRRWFQSEIPKIFHPLYFVGSAWNWEQRWGSGK